MVNFISSAAADSPAWESPEYKELRYKWEFLEDMWQGRSAWVIPSKGIIDPSKASVYLPRMSDEPPDEYRSRILRSFGHKKIFKRAITTTSGYLANYQLTEDCPQSIIENESDIDGRGNSLRLILEQADQKALKDEHCFILVDYPKSPTDDAGNPLITDPTTERLFNRRPTLLIINAIDVINWEETTTNGSTRLTQVTIREIVKEKTGRFSNVNVVQYRVLYPGGYEIWRNNGGEFTLVEEGGTSLDEIPLVTYSVTDDGDIFSGEPPLYHLAELDLNIYQSESNKSEILLRTCLPVYQLNEIVPQNRREDDPYPSVSLGPNSVLWNVDAKIVEPSGSSIKELQADIDRMLMQAQQMTLAFQSGHYAPATATEVNATISSSLANLITMARAKESAVHKIFKLWAKWTKEDYEGGGIVIDRTLIQNAIDSAHAQLLLSLRKNGDLSRRGLFELLQLGKVFPPEFDVEAEVKSIEQDENLDTQERQARIYDVYLKHQVVDADEVARAIAEGKPLSEVINMERRDNERIETFPEGFLATQGPSGFREDLQPGSDDVATGGNIDSIEGL